MLASLFLLTTLLSTCLAQNADCPSGKTYAVKEFESAAVISRANRVSTGSLLNLNSLFYNGTNLAYPSTICLPYPCDNYQVQSGDICATVAQTHGLSLPAFKQYNLDINGECKNMLTGYDVCISAPETAAAGGTGGKTRRRKRST